MKKRNGEIDLLKFLFSVMIIVFHSKNFVVEESEKIFAGGAIAVSFYFIVSGYLMVQSSTKIQIKPDEPTGPLTVQFIWKKIKGMLPNIYVAWVIAFLVETFIVHKGTISTAIHNLFYGIFELTFLNMAGLLGGKVFRANHVTWYLSAMFIVMAFYFPILLKKKKTFLTLISPLVVILIYGYVYTNFKSGFGAPTTSIGLVRKGLLRGFAEIALGCACYLPAQKLKSLNTTRTFKVLMSITALACYGIVVWKAYYKLTPLLNIMLALFLGIGVLISFSGQTIWANLLSHPVFSWLGGFSFDLYISHGFWSHAMSNMFPAMSYRNRFIIYWVLLLATALFVKYFSQWILKQWPSFMNWFRRVMFKPEAE